MSLLHLLDRADFQVRQVLKKMKSQDDTNAQLHEDMSNMKRRIEDREYPRPSGDVGSTRY
jgi:hypothetical protein